MTRNCFLPAEEYLSLFVLLLTGILFVGFVFVGVGGNWILFWIDSFVLYRELFSSSTPSNETYKSKVVGWLEIQVYVYLCSSSSLTRTGAFLRQLCEPVVCHVAWSTMLE